MGQSRGRLGVDTMTLRLLDYDPLTGITTWHEYDAAKDEMKIHTTFTDEPTDIVLDANKDIYNDDSRGYSKSREMKHVARIPNSVIHSWLVNEGIDVYNKDHWDAVKKKLNDSEWRFLRTSPGTI